MRKAFVFILIVLGGLLSLSTSAQKYRIVSDNTWKGSRTYSAGWDKIWFDDSAWGNSVEEPNTGSPPGLPAIQGTKGMWVSPYADSVFFRKSFILKTNCVVAGFFNTSKAFYRVDDEIWIYVNGINVISQGAAPNPLQVDINPYLRVGKNVIAIKAYNRPTTPGSIGPYMVSFAVDIDYTTGAGPEITMSADQSVCEGDSASFEPNQSYQSYLWNNGDVTKQTMVSKAGKYWVSAKDTTGCDWIDTVALVSFPHIDVDLGPDKTLCDGQQATFDAGAGYTKYDWSNGDAAQTITVGYQGEFRVEVTDANGCTSRDTVTTERFNNASVDIGNDTSLCVGDRIVLDATFPFSSYKWEDGSTNPLRSVSDPGNYAVTVTNACGNVTDNVNVSNITDIEVDLGEDDVLCGYQYYELVADVKGATSYEWNTGETTSRIAVEESGEYWVKVIDKCGNEGYDEKELLGGLDRGFVGANSFTPNGDLLNDTWRADIYSYGDYSLTIVNKWNNTMFETNDPLEAWDGRHKGELVPAGTYSYIITYVNCESQKLIITGYVNVIR